MDLLLNLLNHINVLPSTPQPVFFLEKVHFMVMCVYRWGKLQGTKHTHTEGPVLGNLVKSETVNAHANAFSWLCHSA